MVTDCVQKIKISEEQPGFRMRMGCIDHVFASRLVVEKVLEKRSIYGFGDV